MSLFLPGECKDSLCFGPVDNKTRGAHYDSLRWQWYTVIGLVRINNAVPRHWQNTTACLFTIIGTALTPKVKSNVKENGAAFGPGQRASHSYCEKGGAMRNILLKFAAHAIIV